MVFLDITALKQAEAKLHDSVDKFDLAAHAAGLAVWDWDIQNSQLVWDDRMYQLYGTRKENFAGAYEVWLNGVHTEDKIRCEAETQLALRGEKEYDTEFRIVWADGTIRYLKAYAQVVRDADGKPLRMTGINYDITTQKQLEGERQKFVMLADSSSEFIAMCDLEMKPLYVNPAGVRMVGLPDMAAACRVKVQDYFFPEDQPYIRDEFFPHVLREGHGEVEIRLRHFQTGVPIWMSYYLFHMRDSSGTVVGWATVSRDITERRQAEDKIRVLNVELEQRVIERTAQLEEARDRAEVADRVKSAFLATMSHELRTPLKSIIGFTGVLLQGLAGALNAEQDKQLSIVKRAGQHLLELVNDVLDISKIEAGEFNIKFEPVDLPALLQRTADKFSAQATAQGLDFSLTIAPETGSITSNERRLEQVLNNLISNALKFTDQGGIHLSCQPEKEQLRIIVKDTGCGISAGDIAKLFKPFVQLEAGSSRVNQGTGLGLAISRRIVEMLGGKLDVESQPGIGSSFYFTLPLQGMQT